MSTKKTISTLLQNNYAYCGIDHEYDTEQDCDGGCTNDYCRCSRIINAKVISTNLQEILNGIQQKLNCDINNTFDNPMTNPVNVYALGRLLIHHKFYDTELFEINTEGGCYGEVLGSITHENHNKFVKDITNVLCLNSDTSKIEYLLKLEYGEIPQQYKNLNWETKDITIENIHYLQRPMLQATQDNLNNPYQLNTEMQPLLCTENNSHFNLVDGYHRLQCKILNETKTTKAICGKKSF